MQFKGVSGRNDNYSYSMDQVLQSETHTILNRFLTNSTLDLVQRFMQIRSQSTIDRNCRERIDDVEHTDYIANLSCFQTGSLPMKTKNTSNYFVYELSQVIALNKDA